MRQQDKIIVWPTYFDSGKTRAEGRRVPKNLAVSFPRIMELKDAAERLRLENDIVVNRAHPSNPWAKIGMLLVRKKGAKEATINSIAKQLVKARSTATAAETKERKSD